MTELREQMIRAMYLRNYSQGSTGSSASGRTYVDPLLAEHPNNSMNLVRKMCAVVNAASTRFKAKRVRHETPLQSVTLDC
jgi:hypothetical protein